MGDHSLINGFTPIQIKYLTSVLVGRALDLKTRCCGFDSRAGQPNSTACLSDETLNRGPV